MAGVALGDIDRRGTYGTGLALVARLVPVWRRGRRRCLRGRRGTWRSMSLCVAGVALGDNFANFAWQAWHLATLTSTLHDRGGTYGTGLALVARLVPVWRRGRSGCLRGRRGIWRHDRRFTWQAWHLATSTSTLRGRRGTYGTGLALVARLVPSLPCPLFMFMLFLVHQQQMHLLQ